MKRSPHKVRCSIPRCHRIGWHVAVRGIIPGEDLYVCAWCVDKMQHAYTDPEQAEAESEETGYRITTCPDCDGYGTRHNEAPPVNCDRCRGTGVVEIGTPFQAVIDWYSK